MIKSVSGCCVLFAVVLTETLAASKEPVKVEWDQEIEVASDGGYRGPWRMNESKYDYVDDPTAAINEEGVVAVAWAINPGMISFSSCMGLTVKRSSGGR